jgi:hypothetical protein
MTKLMVAFRSFANASRIALISRVTCKRQHKTSGRLSMRAAAGRLVQERCGVGLFCWRYLLFQIFQMSPVVWADHYTRALRNNTTICDYPLSYFVIQTANEILLLILFLRILCSPAIWPVCRMWTIRQKLCSQAAEDINWFLDHDRGIWNQCLGVYVVLHMRMTCVRFQQDDIHAPHYRHEHAFTITGPLVCSKICN